MVLIFLILPAIYHVLLLHTRRLRDPGASSGHLSCSLISVYPVRSALMATSILGMSMEQY